MEKLNQLVGNNPNQAPVAGPVVPLRMTTLPPYPPAATVFMTAEDQFQHRQQTRLAESSQLSKNIKDGQGDLTGDGKSAGTRAKGLWAMVANGLKSSVVEVQMGASSTSKSISGSGKSDRFQQAFEHIAKQGAEFRSAHQGHVVHQGVDVQCDVYVSSTHLCVQGPTMSGICDAIPFKNIVSVVPCVSLLTVENEAGHIGTPFLMPVPNSSVMPTALEVYVRLQTLESNSRTGEFLKYQFLCFTESGVLRFADTTDKERKFGPGLKFIADLDKSWRACVPVPVAGVQYQGGAPPVASSAATALAGAPPVRASTAAPAVDEAATTTKGLPEATTTEGEQDGSPKEQPVEVDF